MKNPSLAARVRQFDGSMPSDRSSDGADPGPHQADAVEVGLLARTFLGTLARLIAFVEQLNLLELFKGFAELRLGILELHAQFVGRTGEVFTALDGRLGIGGIGKVRRIVDAGTLLLGLDLMLEIDRHTLEVRDHALDLGDPAALLVDLKLFQAN
jgi:hypothetical protein